MHLSSYLERFKKITPPNRAVKKEVRGCIQRVIGVDIDERAVDVSNSVAFVREHPAIKNEIKLRKGSILSCIGGKVRDIR